ncbi:MAG TPA: RidA family protein, partial [Longimicrobiales bacterium]|nr:RidA family protein [Longimicrobiales bacterium]
SATARTGAVLRLCGGRHAPRRSRPCGALAADPKPARSALGADGLALGAKVEIECWATVG